MLVTSVIEATLANGSKIIYVDITTKSTVKHIPICMFQPTRDVWICNTPDLDFGITSQ